MIRLLLGLGALYLAVRALDARFGSPAAPRGDTARRRDSRPGATLAAPAGSARPSPVPPTLDGSAPPHYPDFAALMREHVGPLLAEHPDWDRVGGPHGGPQTVATFDHEGTAYRLHGDVEMSLLRAARDFAAANPDDFPFLVGMPRGRRALLLRDSIPYSGPRALYAVPAATASAA